MSNPMTAGELLDFLDGVDNERLVYFIGSGAVHDCVGAETADMEWNNGDVEAVVKLGGYGSNVDDPREGADE